MTLSSQQLMFMTSESSASSERNTFVITDISTSTLAHSPTTIDCTTAAATVLQLTTEHLASSHRAMNVIDTVFVTVVTVTSLLSIPSGLVVITMYVRWTDLRNAGRSMLLQLSVADMLTAIGNIMGVVWFLYRESTWINMAYCKAHSSLTIFSSLAAVFWTTVSALSIFLVLVKNIHNTVNRFWKPIWLVCWGVPATIALTALSMDVLGYDPNIQQANWCWIASNVPHGVVWNFVTSKAWDILAYFLTVVFYTSTRICLLRHKMKNIDVLKHVTSDERVRDASLKLMFLPMVFIVLRVFGLVRYLMGLFSYDVANSPYATWIVLLQGFGDSAQGFCNLLMDVMLTPNVRRRLFYRQAAATSSHSNSI